MRVINNRTFHDIDEYAAHVGSHPRTVRNWITAGYFRVYRVHGRRAVLIDRDEADAALRRLPTTLVRPGFASFGPKAKIVNLAEVVQP